MSEVTPIDAGCERVQAALSSLRGGNGVLVMDDADRENEVDLIFAAETITTDQMAQLIRECSGIVCLCLTDRHLERLQLPMIGDDRHERRHDDRVDCGRERLESPRFPDPGRGKRSRSARSLPRSLG